MDKLIEKLFKEFCKLTNRTGGVLVHSSISEWHKFLARKLEEHKTLTMEPIIGYEEGIFYARLDGFSMFAEGETPQKAVEQLVDMFKAKIKDDVNHVNYLLKTRYNRPFFEKIIINDKYGTYYEID